MSHDHGTCACCGARLFFSEGKLCRPCRLKLKTKGEA